MIVSTEIGLPSSQPFDFRIGKPDSRPKFLMPIAIPLLRILNSITATPGPVCCTNINNTAFELKLGNSALAGEIFGNLLRASWVRHPRNRKWISRGEGFQHCPKPHSRFSIWLAPTLVSQLLQKTNIYATRNAAKTCSELREKRRARGDAVQRWDGWGRWKKPENTGRRAFGMGDFALGKSFAD